MSLLIHEKVALVTGANRGIGKSIVESFLAHGARKVYAGVRHVDRAESLKDAFGERIVTIQLDVTDPQRIAAAAKECLPGLRGECDRCQPRRAERIGGRMTTIRTDSGEKAAITRTIQHYLDGARSGRGNEMRPAFHEEATIFGHIGGDLFGGPIQELFEWNDGNGPAAGLKAQIASIDVVGTVASVRLELDDWTGNRFTDLFTLLKLDRGWKIMNKVFHLHPDPDPS